MGDWTGIGWCHHSFNAWWGCEKVSPACKNCYAERDANRFHPSLRLWGSNSVRRTNSEDYWKKPYKWDRAAAAAGERRRVFTLSMGDFAELHPQVDPWRRRLLAIIRETPNLDWLILTKRPENLTRILPWCLNGGKPWHNVWLGITAEDFPHFKKRWRHVARIPAAVRFVSYEPALGELGLAEALEGDELVTAAANLRSRATGGKLHPKLPAPDWVISGDESGPPAPRPTPVDWHRQVRDDCAAIGAAFFLKQFWRDGRVVKEPELDGRRHVEFPTTRNMYV